MLNRERWSKGGGTYRYTALNSIFPPRNPSYTKGIFKGPQREAESDIIGHKADSYPIIQARNTPSPLMAVLMKNAEYGEGKMMN